MRYADKMNYVKKSAIRSVMADASENGTVDYIRQYEMTRRKQKK